MAGGGHVVHLRGVQHGEAGRLADQPGEVQVGGRGHAVDGDDVDELGVAGDVAADDVHEVDQPVGLEPLQDQQPGLGVDAPRHPLVDGHPQTDDVVRARRAPGWRPAPPSRSAAAFDRTAVRIGPSVGQRRPELVEQVAVGLDLDAVHAGRLHPLGGVGVLGHDALDVPVLGLLRDRPVGRLPHGRGCHDGQPVVLGPTRPPAEVRELDHAGRAVLVDLVGHPPQPRHDLVAVGVEVAEGRRAVLGHHGRARRHRHADAALGLLHVVQPVAVGRQAVLGVRGLVRRREDPVAQRQMPANGSAANGCSSGVVGQRWRPIQSAFPPLRS